MSNVGKPTQNGPAWVYFEPHTSVVFDRKYQLSFI